MVLSFTAQAVAADPGNSNCDAVFEKGGWTEKKIVDTTSGSAATFSVAQVPTGGSPTFYRSTTHKFGKGAIIVAHLKTSTVYDPANQGAIATIGYSYDLRHFTQTLGAVGYRLLVFQNNTYYGGPMNEVYNNTWQNFSGTNLDATKFQKIAGGGTPNPDFSSQGAPITFGYLTANSHTTRRMGRRQHFPVRKFPLVVIQRNTVGPHILLAKVRSALPISTAKLFIIPSIKGP